MNPHQTTNGNDASSAPLIHAPQQHGNSPVERNLPSHPVHSNCLLPDINEDWTKQEPPHMETRKRSFQVDLLNEGEGMPSRQDSLPPQDADIPEEIREDEQEEENEGDEGEEGIDGEEEEGGTKEPGNESIPASPHHLQKSFGKSKKYPINHPRYKLDLSIEDQELTVDPKGELKIDPEGRLRGGRQYRFNVFTLPRHPTKLYCLTAEICRMLDFRDSYIFHLRNRHIPRLYATPEDRDYLSSKQLLPSNFRNRTLGLVTARSLFRQFGHRVIKGGRRIKDDYWVGEQIEPTFAEGKGHHMEHDMNFTSPNYLMSGGTFPMSGAAFDTKAYPEFSSLDELPCHVIGDVDMTRAAASAARFNRHMKLAKTPAFLDHHTRVEHVPLGTQPTRLMVQRRVMDPVYRPDHPDSLVVVVEEKVGFRPPPTETEIHQGWRSIASANEDTPPSRYPLALFPGQFADACPMLTADRFKKLESENREALAAAKKQSADFGYFTTTPFAYMSQLFAPSSSASDAKTSKSAKARIPLGVPMLNPGTYICGELTKTTFQICQKLVSVKGGKCMFHRNVAATSGDASSATTDTPIGPSGDDKATPATPSPSSTPSAGGVIVSIGGGGGGGGAAVKRPS